jgi:hypothetical protein
LDSLANANEKAEIENIQRQKTLKNDAKNSQMNKNRQRGNQEQKNKQ